MRKECIKETEEEAEGNREQYRDMDREKEKNGRYWRRGSVNVMGLSVLVSSLG